MNADRTAQLPAGQDIFTVPAKTADKNLNTNLQRNRISELRGKIRDMETAHAAELDKVRYDLYADFQRDLHNYEARCLLLMDKVKAQDDTALDACENERQALETQNAALLSYITALDAIAALDTDDDTPGTKKAWADAHDHAQAMRKAAGL